MTSPLLALPAALRAAGLDVLEVDGWQTRDRPGLFTPTGVLWHHTATTRRPPHDMPSLDVCIDGRSDLPGPLCQILAGRSGRLAVISVGRCNHAGAGGPLPGIPANDGNRHLVGIELENDGIGEAYPAAQIDAAVTATAVILALLGQTPDRVWFHREWTPRKPDPRGLDAADIRGRVAGRRRTTTSTEGTNMPTTATEQALIGQWQQMLLDNGAALGDSGPARNGRDEQFGRLTLEASKVILDHRNQLLGQVERLTAGNAELAAKAEAAVGASMETIDRLRRELASMEALAADRGDRIAELEKQLTLAREVAGVDIDAALRAIHEAERALGGDGQ